MKDEHARPDKYYTAYVADKNAFWKANERCAKRAVNIEDSTMYDTARTWAMMARTWARMAGICGLGAISMMEITAEYQERKL